MKKRGLIGLVTVAAMLVGLGGMALAQGGVVTQVPGNTEVQDPAGDFLLRNCSLAAPNEPCSLPPSAPLALPAWFDIKTAKITQIDEGRVELFIGLYAPVPKRPPVPFVAYIWQFQDGCVVPSPTDKDGIRVVWNGSKGTWSANWFVITSCNPRTITFGDPVPFEFTQDGVKVRVALSDLLANGKSPGSPLLWYATVRRLPFVHPNFKHTVPVDIAPNVEVFNPSPPPILLTFPEKSATWMPR
jgi:hypothetical protein